MFIMTCFEPGPNPPEEMFWRYLSSVPAGPPAGMTDGTLGLGPPWDQPIVSPLWKSSIWPKVIAAPAAEASAGTNAADSNKLLIIAPFSPLLDGCQETPAATIERIPQNARR